MKNTWMKIVIAAGIPTILLAYTNCAPHLSEGLESGFSASTNTSAEQTGSTSGGSTAPGSEGSSGTPTTGASAGGLPGSANNGSSPGGNGSTGGQSSNVFSLAPSAGDSAPALQSLINKAIARGPGSVVKLQAGTYRLTCSNVAWTYCVDVTKANSLRIEGVPGSTKLMIESPKAGVMRIHSSNNVTISGLTIDYTTPPFSQGRIVNVERNALIYGLDTNYPAPNDSRIFSPCNTGDCEISGHVFDSTGSYSKANTRHDYVGLSGAPENQGGGLWRMRSHNDLTTFVAVGDRVAFSQRATHAITTQLSSNITFEGVNLYTSPNMGFVFVGNDGPTTLINSRILPTPNSGRILSATADAIHVMNSRGAMTVQGGYFTNMGDDGINVKVEGLTVVSASARQAVITVNSTLDIRPGDAIQFLDSGRNGLKLPSPHFAIVVTASRSGNNMTVTFDRDISAVRQTDLAFNASAATRTTVVSGNTFGSSRGAFRIRAPSLQLTNNSFLDAKNAKILFGIESYWNEGPWPSPPTPSGNRVTNGSLELYGFNWSFYQRY